MPTRVRVHFDVVFAEPAFGIRQRAIDQYFQLLDREWFESENQRARDECAVNIKVRIVSSSPN